VSLTSIEWTDRTWNPLTGCTKVSPGCDHCYAKTMHERFNGPGSFDTVTLHPERTSQPLSWRKPSRVFVNSMSDLFHQDVPVEFIARVFATMAAAREHTFQILTKRPARMRAVLNDAHFWAAFWRAGVYERAGLTVSDLPLSNVWLGVSVENQQWADIRLPALLDTPAAVRFLSCEPLLGPVDLNPWLRCPDCGQNHGVRWVIVGGESGPGARPMHPSWARWLRDQCQAAGVPFLFKQWGEYAPATWTASDGSRYVVYPEQMERVGKKRAGRVLDGRTWDEYPERAV
jgi:protein gp37